MKQRLDTLVVQRGLAPSRDRAKRLILAGQIDVDGERADKPGQSYAEDVELRLRGADIPYVSRGGLKLAQALDRFQIDVAGRTALDVGASTGGFTDCLLQRGVGHVYAVDVGRAQLADKLRRDPRVTVMERVNARYLEPRMFERPIDFGCIDVSFISLALILCAVHSVVKAESPVVVLFKPQFEAGRRQVARGGVVRSSAIHRSLLTEHPTRWHGWQVMGLVHSPIVGPAGNIEYLIHLVSLGDMHALHVPGDWQEQVDLCVTSAHRELH